MKENSQIASDNLGLYRVVAMTMVVLYHCTCYYTHPSWPFGEGPYNSVLKKYNDNNGRYTYACICFYFGIFILDVKK